MPLSFPRGRVHPAWLRLLTCGAFGLLAPGPSHAAPPPNILFILADQWRAQAFGHAGDPNLRTPHLDKLQRQGIRFVNAVSTVPVCSPARASLMTGQRALTHGVFLNDVPPTTPSPLNTWALGPHLSLETSLESCPNSPMNHSRLSNSVAPSRVAAATWGCAWPSR